MSKVVEILWSNKNYFMQPLLSSIQRSTAEMLIFFWSSPWVTVLTHPLAHTHNAIWTAVSVACHVVYCSYCDGCSSVLFLHSCVKSLWQILLECNLLNLNSGNEFACMYICQCSWKMVVSKHKQMFNAICMVTQRNTQTLTLLFKRLGSVSLCKKNK